MNEVKPVWDKAIRCGILLTMNSADCPVQKNKVIGLRGNQIIAIEDDASDWQAGEIIDQSRNIVLPGLVNAHTHLPMNLLRGVGDDQPLMDWLQKTIFPLEAKLVSPEFCRLGTQHALLESIAGGVTTLCDMYYFAEDIADEVDKSGIRAIIGESAINFPVPDDLKQDGNNYRILDRMCEKYAEHPRITPAVAPHAPYTCSNDLLMKVADYAEQQNIPVTIHMNETLAEVEGSLKEYQKRPFERLADIGFLQRISPICAHCVHVNDDEMQIIKENNCSVIYNPESNMKLGSGIAPIVNYIKKGIRVGIATDGAASNNDLNMILEMNTGAKLQKLSQSDNTAMTARQALYLGTLGGALALNLGDITGSLEIGKRADLIAINCDAPHMQPLHDPFSQIVYAARGDEVCFAMCEGKTIYQNGQFVHLSQKEILDKVDQYISRHF